jgi:hypothetical protein
VAVAIVSSALYFRGGSTCENRIDAWASENGLLLQSAVPTSSGGDNPWSSFYLGRATRFYRVTIVDSSGTTRLGWVRIGPGLAVGTGKLAVRWAQ